MGDENGSKRMVLRCEGQHCLKIGSQPTRLGNMGSLGTSKTSLGHAISGDTGCKSGH